MGKEYLFLIKNIGVKEELKKMGANMFELQQSILLDDGSEESIEEITIYLANINMILNEIIRYYDINYSKIADKIAERVYDLMEAIKNDRKN